jgi:DNA-binding NtrC family response regulator
MDTLITWIGDQDLQAADLMDGTPKIEGGAVLSAIKAGNFERVFLLIDYCEQQASDYKNWLSDHYTGELYVENVDLDGDPTDVSKIYEASCKLLDRLTDESRLPTQPTFLISSGTWAMAVVMVIISQTRYEGQLIQSSKEAGVQTVEIPFEVHAEYLSKLVGFSDEGLIKSNTLRKPLNFGNIPFRSDVMQRLATKAAKASQRNFPILIEGDIGTEKEEFARAIHFKGTRQEGKFIKVPCNLRDIDDLNTRLFGDDNAFDQAKGGIVYLDEVNSLPENLQGKLYEKLVSLANLEELGSAPILTNTCRIIASSRKDLVQTVANSGFHEELFFALSVLVLKIPALRERRNDISPLIDQILEKINNESINEPGYQTKSLTPGARSVLIQRDWPANTRELENSLKRAAVWSSDDIINEADIWDAVFETPPTTGALHEILDIRLEDGIDLKAKLGEIADHLIDRAIEHEGENRSNAAKLLGFESYQAFAYWAKRREKKKQVGS